MKRDEGLMIGKEGKICHNSCFFLFVFFPLERTDLESNKYDLIVSLTVGAVTIKCPQSKNSLDLTPL